MTATRLQVLLPPAAPSLSALGFCPLVFLHAQALPDLSLGCFISSGPQRPLCWGPSLVAFGFCPWNPLCSVASAEPCGALAPGAAPLLEARGSGGYVWLRLDLALGTLSIPGAEGEDAPCTGHCGWGGRGGALQHLHMLCPVAHGSFPSRFQVCLPGPIPGIPWTPWMAVPHRQTMLYPQPARTNPPR